MVTSAGAALGDVDELPQELSSAATNTVPITATSERIP